MTKIFIVILNWNGKKDTLACLESMEKLILKNTDCQIVVVDNGSTDDSVAAFKKFQSKIPLVVLETYQNLGFAAGNNVGIEYSLAQSADFVMILNNDTLVDKNLVQEFLNGAKNYPKAGILSPKIYFAKGYEFHKKRYKSKDLGKVIWSAGGKFDWNNVYGNNIGVDEVDKGQFDSEHEIDFATGACMFISARALKKVGTFDDRYFLYLEDGDLSIRMKKNGWNVQFIPKAVIWHKVSQSSVIGSDLNDYFITRNRLLFGMKYAPLRAKFALIRESIWFVQNGRTWQAIGAKDFYLRKFGKGSWK